MESGISRAKKPTSATKRKKKRRLRLIGLMAFPVTSALQNTSETPAASARIVG
jgi:hypothetical protein